MTHLDELCDEYTRNIPDCKGDVELYRAVKVAIYTIVVSQGRKVQVVRSVAHKYVVPESMLMKCIEEAIPESFYKERSRKARKRQFDSFYKDSLLSEHKASKVKKNNSLANEYIGKIREKLK